MGKLLDESLVCGEDGSTFDFFNQMCDIENLRFNLFKPELAELLWLASQIEEVNTEFKDFNLKDDDLRQQLYQDYTYSKALTIIIPQGKTPEEISQELHLNIDFLRSLEFKRIERSVHIVHAIKERMLDFLEGLNTEYQKRRINHYIDSQVSAAQFKYFELELNDVIEALEGSFYGIFTDKPDSSNLKKMLIAAFDLVKNQKWNHEINQAEAIQTLEYFLPINLYKDGWWKLANIGVYQLIQFKLRTKKPPSQKALTETTEAYSFNFFIPVIMKAYKILKRIEDTQSYWSLEELADVTGLTESSVMSGLNRDVRDPKNAGRYPLVFENGVSFPMSYMAGRQWICNRGSYKGVFGDARSTLKHFPSSLEQMQSVLIQRNTLLGEPLVFLRGNESTNQFYKYLKQLLEDNHKLTEVCKSLHLDIISFWESLQKIQHDKVKEELLQAQLDIQRSAELSKVVTPETIKVLIQEKELEAMYKNFPSFSYIFNLNKPVRGEGSKDLWQSALRQENEILRKKYRYYCVNDINHNKLHVYLDVKPGQMFCFNGASNPLPFLIAHEHHFKNKQVIWLPFSEVILKSLKEIFQKSKAVVIEKVTAETKPKRPKDFEAHECLSEKFDVIKCTLLTGNSAEEKAKNIDLKTILDASDLDGYRPEGYLG